MMFEIAREKIEEILVDPGLNKKTRLAEVVGQVSHENGSGAAQRLLRLYPEIKTTRNV